MKRKFVLWHLQGGVCFYCAAQLRSQPVSHNERFKPELPLKQWNLEHVIPKSRGGRELLAVACVECNQSKGSAPPTENHIRRAEHLKTLSDKVVRLPKRKRYVCFGVQRMNRSLFATREARA